MSTPIDDQPKMAILSRPHTRRKKGGGSCLESAPRAFEAAGTRSHCNVQVTSVQHGFGTSSGPTLGPHFATHLGTHFGTPKCLHIGAPEALPDGYCSEMKEDEVLASSALALSIRPRCNLTAKTQVFLKILTFTLFPRSLIYLLSRNLKKAFKINL